MSVAARGDYPSDGKVNSLAAADYDNDGDLDLNGCGQHPNGAIKTELGLLGIPMPSYDANDGGPNKLYRNEGAPAGKPPASPSDAARIVMAQLDKHEPRPIPSSILLDSAGRIAVIYKGPMEMAQVAEASAPIQPALGSPPQPPAWAAFLRLSNLSEQARVLESQELLSLDQVSQCGCRAAGLRVPGSEVCLASQLVAKSSCRVPRACSEFVQTHEEIASAFPVPGGRARCARAKFHPALAGRNRKQRAD